MKSAEKSILNLWFRVAEILLSPLTFLGGQWLKLARRYGIEKLPFTRAILLKIGVFPIRDHYYEPQFKFRTESHAETRERSLPGVNLNIEAQLKLLSQFHFQEELRRLPMTPGGPNQFGYQNNMFGAGDAEFLYSLVRLIKPGRIIEIGCGFSTLMTRHALAENQKENPKYACQHTCIEPYENPWLAQTGVRLVREPLENLPVTDFAALEPNDILFIDSSHMIRPGGDVLHEFLEILPLVKPGVYIHIHDIFTPFDYPDQWVRKEMRFWNEQYLLEALLSGNSSYEIVAGMYFLSRKFPEKLAEKFPIFAAARTTKPGSFWLVKR